MACNFTCQRHIETKGILHELLRWKMVISQKVRNSTRQQHC